MNAPMMKTACAIFVFGLVMGNGSAAWAASEVKVVNTPSVVVPTTIPHGELKEFVEIPVPARGSTALPIDLHARGFTAATISLAVDVQGAVDRSGMVTATLLPDVPFVIKTYQNEEIKLFPIDVGVHVPFSNRDNVFGSQPMVFPLAFPSYKVFFSNDSDRPIKAYLYIHLTN